MIEVRPGGGRSTVAQVEARHAPLVIAGAAPAT
jgi:hypothetical protein